MALTLGLSACLGNGGVDRPGEVITTSTGTGPAYELRIFSTPGERIRTRKQLSVTEILPRGDQATSTIDESFVQSVISVDASGQPLQVIRTWERFHTRVDRPGAEPVEQTSSLEGSEVELTRRVSGVTARVVSGGADATQLTGMLIGGMEAAMLPSAPVRVGDRWVIDAGQRGEFSGIFKALGLTPTRSEQRCALVAIGTANSDWTADVPVGTESNHRVPEPASPERSRGEGRDKPEIARISIDWQITGTMSGPAVPMVMRLSGEMTLDLSTGLVTKLELTGGRQTGDGTVHRQIAMLIERTPVKGWYE